jgi:hypothetical protein
MYTTRTVQPAIRVSGLQGSADGLGFVMAVVAAGALAIAGVAGYATYRALRKRVKGKALGATVAVAAIGAPYGVLKYGQYRQQRRDEYQAAHPNPYGTDVRPPVVVQAA